VQPLLFFLVRCFTVAILLFAESPFPLNIVLDVCYSAYVKGDHTGFEIDPSVGVESSELYPDVKYATVDEYLNRFL
jgi:phenylcoumaran benzylic ether reductase